MFGICYQFVENLLSWTTINSLNFPFTSKMSHACDPTLHVMKRKNRRVINYSPKKKILAMSIRGFTYGALVGGTLLDRIPLLPLLCLHHPCPVPAPS